MLFVDPLDQPEPAYDIGYDGLFTDVARKTFAWGTRKQSEGKVSSFAGAARQGAAKGTGKLTGKQDLTAEDAATHVGESAGQTIHELNQ